MTAINTETMVEVLRRCYVGTRQAQRRARSTGMLPNVGLAARRPQGL